MPTRLSGFWRRAPSHELLSALPEIDRIAKVVRKVKEGETTNDLFGFLTTEPNAEVGAIHPKAMPVILTMKSNNG
jgi:putative SOS response-associated peptidase YedK